jgi:Tol biopolymer transport system component/DNA-binding winged helix-turn-helix (wHTH) protein
MHTPPPTREIAFGPFRADPRTRELRKAGTRIRVPEQSVRILLGLLDRSGDVVTREELAAILWPSETGVDVEHGLNSAVRRLRDALGDSAERPVYIETVPRVGYRFVGSVEKPLAAVPEVANGAEKATETPERGLEPESSPNRVIALSQRRRRLGAAGVVLLAAVAAIVAWRGSPTTNGATSSHAEPIPLTFEGGLQTDPSFSFNGAWIAYASDSGGNFDIWIRRLSGGEPVQVTHDEAADYQPDWSPDGSRLVFRSERAGGGLFIVPMTGGAAKRISDSGYRPRWSPDGRQILFAERVVTGLNLNLQVIDLDSGTVHRCAETGSGAFGWQPNSSTVLRLSSSFGPFKPALVSWTVAASSLSHWTVVDEVTNGFRAQQLAVIGGEEVMPSPDMSSLYFVGESRGRRALWRVDVDATARRVTSGPHRVTATLPDANNASLSPDGNRVVFDGAAQNARVFSDPLDRDAGMDADPTAMTSEAAHAGSPTLSRDGRAFGFVLTRPGSPDRSELTARLPGQSRDQTIRVIDHPREVLWMPRWNGDGTKLAYSLVSNANDEASAQQQEVSHDAGNCVGRIRRSL